MLRLYNTMERGISPFKPTRSGEVKMFTCGPSIYGRPHLGNYRTFLWEDVLERYLRHLGYSVRRVMNLTDIEDKALAEAQRIGTNVHDLTEANARQFKEECTLLHIAVPEYLPRSSTTVEQAADLIRILMDKGVAYEYRGDVYFDPLKVKGFGRLYGLDMSRWPTRKRRFRQDTYPGRRWNLGDFILWHGCGNTDTVCWDTPLGHGRPSWNIQDPAMITKYLGFQIDIACGGIDNLHRHHDYNLAVIEAASGKEFCRHWMHCEHLLVGGKKMSKSLGNIIYPEDLTREGFTGQQIRFYLIFGEHRVRQSFTRAQFEKACGVLAELRALIERLAPSDAADSSPAEGVPAGGSLMDTFEQCMDDNLNVKSAVQALQKALQQAVDELENGRLGERNKADIHRQLQKIDSVLQVLFVGGSA